MRILHIIDSGGLYGAEIMLLHLMEAQLRLGLEPILASIGDLEIDEKPVETEARRRGLRVVPFRMRSGPNWAGAWRILGFARQQQVQLLHSHGYKGNILFGLLPRRLRGLPMVATLHGWTWTGGLTRMLVYEQLDALSLRFVDKVVLVNAAMKEHPCFQGRRGYNLAIIENGVPLAQPLASEPMGRDLRQDVLSFAREAFTIGAAGRFSREKGFAFLLEALAGLVAEGHDLRLVILGEGGLRQELNQQVAALGLGERVLMPGYVAAAGRYLPGFNLFVLPSLTEGLPMVLLEAMSAGLPIVASRIGGIPAALDQGRAGLLVEPRDVDSLKAGIRAIIEDPCGAEQRSAAASDRVRTLYSSSAMAGRYFDVYRQLVPEAAACVAGMGSMAP